MTQMGLAQATITENRALPRDEVHYRARASGPDMRPVTLLIVNMSALGLMARCEVEFAPGDRIRVVLPVVGHALCRGALVARRSRRLRTGATDTTGRLL